MLMKEWAPISKKKTHLNPAAFVGEFQTKINQLRRPLILEHITGADLQQAVARRKAKAAGGADGWTTAECKLLLLVVW